MLLSDLVALGTRLLALSPKSPRHLATWHISIIFETTVLDSIQKLPNDCNRHPIQYDTRQVPIQNTSHARTRKISILILVLDSRNQVTCLHFSSLFFLLPTGARNCANTATRVPLSRLRLTTVAYVGARRFSPSRPPRPSTITDTRHISHSRARSALSRLGAAALPGSDRRARLLVAGSLPRLVVVASRRGPAWPRRRLQCCEPKMAGWASYTRPTTCTTRTGSRCASLPLARRPRCRA